MYGRHYVTKNARFFVVRKAGFECYLCGCYRIGDVERVVFNHICIREGMYPIVISVVFY